MNVHHKINQVNTGDNIECENYYECIYMHVYIYIYKYKYFYQVQKSKTTPKSTLKNVPIGLLNLLDVNLSIQKHVGINNLHYDASDEAS